MPVRTKLPREIVKALDKVGALIRSFVEEERCAYDEMSLRWQEGDRAADVLNWLDSLDETADALDGCRASIHH